MDSKDFSQSLYTGTPSVPPPPDADSSAALAEVVIRTMASDIELLGETGGSAPRGTTVAVAAVPGREAAEQDGASAEESSPPQTRSGRRMVFWSLGGIALIAGLFFAGYYLIPFIVTRQSGPPPAAIPRSPQATGALPDFGDVGFVHESFFAGPSDAIITVSLDDPAISAETRPFAAQVASLLKSANPQAKFFEIENRLMNDSMAPWNAFASSTGLNLLSADFVSARFDPDFTAFAVRDKDVFWPGYILKLKKGQTPLTLRIQAAGMIEGAAPNFPGLFLTPLPTSSATSTNIFQDAQVNNQSVRLFSFGRPNAPVVIYGWFFNSYLVISTSEDGLRQAVSRL